MAAPSYIKYGTTQCTNIKATNFQTTGTVDMNYVYYSTSGLTYNCVYKRPDPSDYISGSVEANLTKNRSGGNTVISVNSMSISGSYKYRSMWATNAMFAPDTTVNATTSYTKYTDYINVNLQTQYYTPCEDYGVPPSSATTLYKYTITGTFTISNPYYAPDTYNSSRIHGNVTITSYNLNSSNSWQNNSMSISFKWTDAYYGSSLYSSLALGSNGSRISRDISIYYSVPSYVDAYMLLINTSGYTVLSHSFSGTKTLTCVKVELIPQCKIEWSKSTVGSTQYVNYKTFTVSTSNSVSYTDHYTESNSSTIACNFGVEKNDIDCSVSNLVSFINYNYLTFTFVSGYTYTITNTDKISHTVYYNKKKCNSGDAKNWTGLSDVTSVTISAGSSKTVTLQSNWWANAQTCSFTTNNYRYISYIVDGDSSYSTNRISI